MIRKFLLIVAFLPVTTVVAQDKKKITLEDIYKKGTFSVKDVPGFKAMNDGESYTQIDQQEGTQQIRRYKLANGKLDRTIFENTSHVKIDEYLFSTDEKKLMLLNESENIYRRSVLHKVYIYNTLTNEMQALDDEKVLHATFSPDGTKVAYVKSNNLYCKNLTTGQVTQITYDGAKNAVINGNCDWVYEEEFEFTRAFEWNKDGRYLAYYRFDETQVPEYTFSKYTSLYPAQYTYKYPKAGEKNSLVQIKMYDIVTGKTIEAETGNETDQYIPRIKWTEDAGALCIFRMNRLQNKLDLLLTDVKTGRSTNIYTEKNKRYVEVTDNITFLPNEHSFLMTSERDGYNHIYRYNWNTRNLTDLTTGNFDVAQIMGVDKATKMVYYTAAARTPLERELYVVGWNGYSRNCLTPEKGMHQITMCENNKYFLDKFSTITKAPVYYLRDGNGKIVRTLEDNQQLKSTIQQYDLGKVSLIKVKGVKEWLNAWMITPPGFDKNKKYPVLMFQYSGPGSQQVFNQFQLGNMWWHQLLAQNGYIVVCADGTGTGFRGEEFKKKTYLQLGKYESEDQIAVARYLGNLAYVDKSRIGIWGWSFGGFMSSTCLMKGNDVFKTAIAVAPVTNWRYYDNIYTERYMRTPAVNADGYDKNSPVTMVDQLKGNFLLIHGTADDNVHFQNAAMLTTAMVNANKEFDSECYPDKNHGISGGNTRFHLFSRMTRYILEKL